MGCRKILLGHRFSPLQTQHLIVNKSCRLLAIPLRHARYMRSLPNQPSNDNPAQKPAKALQTVLPGRI